MSEPTYDPRALIVLPEPRPHQNMDGRWKRTWKVRLCAPAKEGSWPKTAPSSAQGLEQVSFGRQGERDLEIVVSYEGSPFSDESFVFGPRRIFRQIEDLFGRIELIEGIARSLWMPFRPKFHRIISNPYLDPVHEILEAAIRASLAQPGWEHAIIHNICDEPCRFSRINFAQVSELLVRSTPDPSTVAVRWAVLRKSLVLLSDTPTPEVLSICQQADAEMGDRWVKRMALAS